MAPILPICFPSKRARSEKKRRTRREDRLTGNERHDHQRNHHHLQQIQHNLSREVDQSNGLDTGLHGPEGGADADAQNNADHREDQEEIPPHTRAKLEGTGRSRLGDVYLATPRRLSRQGRRRRRSIRRASCLLRRSNRLRHLQRSNDLFFSVSFFDVIFCQDQFEWPAGNW